MSDDGRGMWFGLCTDQCLAYAELAERWRRFESFGLDSLWVCDHLNMTSKPELPYFEGWTTLAALAGATSTVRIGVLVSSNTFRHPGLLAQQAVTLDHVSNGRLEFGIGAGYAEGEHTRFGIELPSPGDRRRAFGEAVRIIDSLMRNETTTFAGRYYQLDGAYVRPGPVQTPRPPFVLGAHGPRMLRIVAEFADTWNSSGTIEEMRERGAILDEHCAAIGRDPGEIRRSWYGWGWKIEAQGLPSPWESADAFDEVVGRYHEAGVSEFIIDAPEPGRFAMLERLAADVMPRLRGARA